MTDINKLITDNIDVWASAITKKSSTGRGSSKKIELTGINKLRELILELAIRGKLVPQDPNDEPASELLKKIEAEKAQLVKEGLLKKQKPLAPITDEEKPFELPNNWEFSKLGDFVYVEMGQSPPSKFYNQDNDGLPFFQGKADFGAMYPTARYWCVQPQKYAYDGDVLLSVRAPVGPTNIANIECCIGRGLSALRPLCHVPTNYVYYMMHGFRSNLESFATGTTFVAVSKVNVDNLVVSIPPLAEQHRIVAKVDDLMVLCDELEAQTEFSFDAHQLLVEELLSTLTNSESAQAFEQNWARIAQHFDLLFTTEHSIEQLKQTILQLAVMGKLVPQDPTDEPAPKLLERIVQEKEQLIIDKAIKKQKPLPDVSDKEKPFEVPKGWEWARVGDLLSLKNGYAFKSKYFVENKSEFILTTPGNFYEEGGFRHRGEKTKYYDGPIDAEYIFDSGDLIIPMTEQAAGLLGSAAFVPNDQNKYLHNQRLGKLSPYSNLTTLEFIYLFFNSSFLRTELARTCTGMKVRHTSPDRILKVLIPVMSPREQVRITAKVDELLSICKQLKLRIIETSSTQIHLAETIVDKALNRTLVIKLEDKEEKKAMKISTELSLGNVTYDKTAILAPLIGEDGADAKSVWSKSGLKLPDFYRQLKSEITLGFVSKPAKAEFEG
tara:strand:+ start:6759 stop:8753 length:1995 start_codon:yes stop_codon:yes gene_type:complete